VARLIGIDIGTTSTIGILVESGGAVLATASRPVDLRSPHPGWAEEDPEQWWNNTVAILRDMLAASPGPVAAIGVTGMVPAVVLRDGAGALLRPSIQQSDGRTSVEVEEIRAEVDEAAFIARTGNGVNQQLVAPKLRWLRRHEPDVFARIATIRGSYDDIAWRLCGAASLERNWALEAGFLDLRTDAIADDLVALGGVAREVLPPLRAPHEVIGGVTAEVAALTGLALGTPVVAGCADHVASAFVAGVTAPGDLLIKFGGAGDVLLATRSPSPDPRLFLDFHLVPGLFLPNGCMATSGAVLNWVAREWGGGLSHAQLDALAAGVTPGAEGLLMLPYFLGEKTPLHDPNARGTLIGLGLHHGMAHVWRAALEAVCFGFRHHLEVLRELGHGATRVIASDGGAGSPVWMQIAADVLGLPIQLLQGHPGSCLGAAYVAGVGVGAFEDWNAIGRFVTPAGRVEPDPAAVARYDAIHLLWRESYERLKPLFPKLAAVT
jgi:xylulokinase